MTSSKNGKTYAAERDPSTASLESSGATSRRHFLQTGSAISAGVAYGIGTGRAVRGAEPSSGNSDVIRIGLVGAGGRGKGAANDNLSINENVKLVAVADVDETNAMSVEKTLSKRHPGKVDITSDSVHVGLDSYKAILDDPNVDLVLMTTPPGFRPQYVAEAVDAGKHVFAEKPSCVDPAGYRICLQADEQAKQNNTCIVTGTQYRRQASYVEAVQRIHDGMIGDIVSATARYCSTGIWHKPRREGMTEAQYQIFNWMHFIWLSGDQIAEQAVHNIDTINWIMGGPPESAYGSGGRFTRPEGSEMWDSMSIDYQYPGNRLVSFKCRQIPGSQGDNSNVIRGSNGHAVIYGGNKGSFIYDKDGEEVWSTGGDIGAAYQQEHKELVDAIRADKPIVELKQTADSSLTAVLGRMAAYTGKKVDWEFATEKSKLSLFPDSLTSESALPEAQHAVPGKTKLI